MLLGRFTNIPLSPRALVTTANATISVALFMPGVAVVISASGVYSMTALLTVSTTLEPISQPTATALCMVRNFLVETLPSSTSPSEFPFGRDKYTLDQLMPFMRHAYRYFRRHFYNRVRLQIKQAIAAKTNLDQVRFLAVELVQRGYGSSAVRMANARIYELLPEGAEFSYPPRGTYVPTLPSGNPLAYSTRSVFSTQIVM